MEDSEKLAALKKAYADIILNTAKEAAARIMVSERKAMRFQRELISTKEESLRMLLRLKQMLDSKVSGAKMTSLSQQKKIEELEAQLQEAEEIVSDLRAELREVQAELEKVTNSQVFPAVEQNIEGEVGAHEKNLQENRFDHNEYLNSVIHQFESATIYDTRNSTVIGTNEIGECCVSCGHVNNCYLHNPDFASIVIKRKGPELYQNGCTQRIRAFERSLFDRNMSLFGNIDGVQNEKLVRGDEGGKRMSLTINFDNMCEEEQPDEAKVVRGEEAKGISATINAHSKCEAEKPDVIELVRGDGESKKMFLVTDSNVMCEAKKLDEHEVAGGDEGKGISVTTNADIMFEAGTQDELQLVRGDEGGKGMSMTTNTDVMCEVEKRMALQSSETTTITEQSGSQNDDKDEIVSLKNFRRKVKKMKRKCNVRQSRLHGVKVKHTNKATYLSRKIGSKIYENETENDVISPAKVLNDTTAMTEQPGPRCDIAKGKVFLKACGSFNKKNDDNELLDKSDLTGRESLSTENLEVPVCRADVELATASSDKLSQQVSDLDEKVSSQSVNDRFLKYTFQRKRKKESLRSPDVDCSLEKGSLKKIVEKMAIQSLSNLA